MLPLIEDRIHSCFAMTEVEMSGSNLAIMDTTAVKDGGDYVINGQKWYTTAVDGAQFTICMAETNPAASPYQQASMIIDPTDNPGFNLIRNIPVMGHAGSGYPSHGEVLFQSCRVPQNNLLGLKPVFAYCPQPLVYTEDESVIGCQFYVMERIPSIILRRDILPGTELNIKRGSHPQ